MGGQCACADADTKIEIPNLVAQYTAKRLPVVEMNAYKDDFERDFFMIVNLLRDNPLSF